MVGYVKGDQGLFLAYSLYAAPVLQPDSTNIATASTLPMVLVHHNSLFCVMVLLYVP